MMSKQKAARPELQIHCKWPIALGLLMIFLVLLKLGFWQLDRAEQKRQSQNERDSRRMAKPVAIEAIDFGNINALTNRKVILEGNYDDTKSIFVSNQIYQGRPGYEVITVFKLDASNQLILVSKGWIAANYPSRQLPAIEPVPGNQNLVVEIYVPTTKSFYRPQVIEQPVNWPLRLHHFDINSISQLLDRPVMPVVARLGPNNPGVLKRHWRDTQLLATNSTSYAIQWFGMAFLLVLITLVKSTNILEIIRSKKSR